VKAHRVVRRRGSHIFSRQSAHRWLWGQPYAPAALYPPGRFLVLISLRSWVYPKAIVWLEGLGQLKKIHLIGTRTRDLPACSIVPQPTTLQRRMISEEWMIRVLMEVVVAWFKVLNILSGLQGVTIRKTVLFEIRLDVLTYVCMKIWCDVLTPLSWVAPQLNKSPVFYGTRRFSNVFTKARHRSLSWGEIGSIPKPRVTFRNMLGFRAEGLLLCHWKPKMKDCPLSRRLSLIAYSLHLHLPSMSGGHLHPQTEDVPRDKGPT
jgi:hypothetical protein